MHTSNSARQANPRCSATNELTNAGPIPGPAFFYFRHLLLCHHGQCLRFRIVNNSSKQEAPKWCLLQDLTVVAGATTVRDHQSRFERSGLLGRAANAGEHFRNREGVRDQLPEGQAEDGVVLGFVGSDADDVHVEAEFAERLPAVAARPRIAALGGEHGDGEERLELGQSSGFGANENTVDDGAGDGHLFGMLGLRVAGVLDVASGEDFAVEGQHRGADVVLRVGTISDFCCLLRGLDQLPVEGLVFGRHLDQRRGDDNGFAVGGRDDEILRLAARATVAAGSGIRFGAHSSSVSFVRGTTLAPFAEV